MTQAIRDSAQALLDAYAENGPYRHLHIKTARVALQDAMTAQQPAADERVAERMRLTVAELEARIKALEDDLATARQRAEDCQMRMLDAEDDNFHGSKAAVFVNALKDRIASLEADLREERERRSAAQIAWAAEVESLTARLYALRSDRDCEKRLRKDAEDVREAAMGLVAELQAAFRTLASAYPGAPLSRVELRTFAGMEP